MNKLQRVNEYLGVTQKEFERLGIYNGYSNIDSELFINPKLLNSCDIPEFRNSYTKVVNHFEKIIRLLKKCKKTSKDDLMWDLALKMFSFPEPKGVALGTSDLSIEGNGLSGETAENALIKLKEMIDNDIDDPMIFGMLAIIQKNIGVDRISDMISNIIYDDLLDYTQNMLIKLKINDYESVEYNNKIYKLKLRENGSILILLPKSILSNIPPFVDSRSIQEIIDKNIEIKKQIYKMFYEANTKLKSKKISQVNVKDLDKDQIYTIVKEFNLHSNILKANSDLKVKPYDFDIDSNGIHKPIEKIAEMYAKRENDVVQNILNVRNENFSSLIEDLINNFKFIIESKGLNKDLYNNVKTKNGKTYLRPRHEGTAHRFFISTLEGIKTIFNFDYTYEPKSSNGEVDFRFFRNDEIILVEFKLSSNNLLDGYNNQLTEYMIREKSNLGYLVVINVTDNKSVENFLKNVKHEDNKKIIVIDGTLKSSPSKIHKNK